MTTIHKHNQEMHCDKAKLPLPRFHFVVSKENMLSFFLFMLCTNLHRKLIGARFFSKGYESKHGNMDKSLHTARDVLGHGTPTLSIAGGNFVSGASVFGFGNGTAKGGSPRSHVAAYKVCGLGTIDAECTDADIIKAFEDAINDGVDVISCSLGKSTPTEFFEDGVSIGAFHAVANGIIVVAAGGNKGPQPGTVTNVAPWLFSVGASTIDRNFANYIALGDKKHLMVPFFCFFSLPFQFRFIVSVRFKLYLTLLINKRK